MARLSKVLRSERPAALSEATLLGFQPDYPLAHSVARREQRATATNEALSCPQALETAWDSAFPLGQT